MQSLTVCMMVQNVEKTLPIALESLGNIYDELIIVDGGSQDKTCEVASRYGARIIHSKWSGNHSQQRNIYLQEVKTDWVFVIDSDEFIDKPTKEFLHFIKQEGDSVDTDNFWFPRKWISPFSQKLYISSSPHCPDFQRRLFKYQKDVVYSGLVHESLHGLTHAGLGASNCSIYHLDLFINTEVERREKIRRYMNVDPRNGALHFYLPDIKNIQLEECNYEDILPSVQNLLSKMTHISDSDLNKLIAPEIKNDDFYAAINKIARESDIKTVLEIGSSSGEGSTEAFVTGLRENQNKPTLFCMEVSQARFEALQQKYKNDGFVKCYNVSSVSVEKFPNEGEVINFYNGTPTGLNQYPLQEVLRWLQQDIEYVKNSGVVGDGIKKIKQENNIAFFDVVLIDGSEFTGSVELDEVYGAKFILLDDINTFKNFNNLKRLVQDNNYSLIDQNLNVRNGYAIFQKNAGKQMSYKNIQPAVEAIEGFMIPGQEEYLFKKVQSLPNDAVIVEIGSYKGRSTVAMGYACIGTNRTIYCIDTWDGNDSDFDDRNFFDIWQHNVRSNNLDQYVVPLRDFSHEILKRWEELTNNSSIDFIFIDGSHQYLDVLQDFEMSFPLVKNGGWIAFHDVIYTWPGCERVWHEIAKLSLVNHEYSSTLACGQKVANLSIASAQIPVHFFTIVINGEPFIRYHIDIFRQLPFNWHWHIVEGVADLKHDTAWSLQLGGGINNEIHRNGRSKDGTTEYLDELAQLYPGNVTVYRKPEGVFWNGKREMVNEPIFNIREECLLWQVDVDELWTIEQICEARQMFINNPDKTAAFYWCWYFVSENLVISTRNCYAQNPQQDWLRTWRYKPGAVWVAHEPPVLAQPLPNGQWFDVAKVNPFKHEETEKHGLIFQHFAYVTPEQLSFKEQYYGYSNAVSRWTELQTATQFPVLLSNYFGWVQDETMVDTAESLGLVAIAQKEKDTNVWRFIQEPEHLRQSGKMQKHLPTVIIDGVFFQLYKTGIARVWQSLLEEWAVNGFAKQIVVLDRAGTAPKISGIQYRSVPPYDYAATDADRQMLQTVCDEEGADLFISTYYTTPISTPSVFMAYDMIPEVLGANFDEPMWREKHNGIRHASAYISISENTAKDLVKISPNISPDLITVAHCGVRSSFTPASLEAIESFRKKYGVSKSYFILVGAAGDRYKNIILFLEAFAQLPSKNSFDIIITGSGGVLREEYRSYTSGSTVHMLQLSDEDLRVAYSGAIALVYPSQYEGFGLPVLEALACGCPVITCPNASIPEVAGEAAIYVNDTDVNGLANALCDVQKPELRRSLITASLEQAKKFSWSKMAETVSSALINATLLPLNLREINLIIFPDWEQSEESLSLELEQVIRTIATHPASSKITLLIDTHNISEEDAGMLLSSVAMNLLMQEDLDISESVVISLLTEIGELQWDALSPRLHGRIILENENKQAISKPKSQRIPAYALDEIALIAPLQLEQYLSVICSPTTIFKKPGDVESYYQLMSDGVNYIYENTFSNKESSFWQNAASFFTLNANFINLYFTKANLRAMYKKRAEIMELTLKFQGYEIDYEFPERQQEQEKIRLGIISDNFKPKPETFATLPIFKHLNREIFEIIIYAIEPTNHRLERYLYGHADSVVQVPNDLGKLVTKLREEDLDILFIANNVTARSSIFTLLALHRMARIQIVGMNCPVTTGMRHVDYYISGKLTEPDQDAQQNYTETLLTIEGPAQCFDFATEENLVATKSITRESLGIGDNTTVYISGANCYKIIPEVQATWAQIIANVPNSILLLYPFNPNWSGSYEVSDFKKCLISKFVEQGLQEDRLILIEPLPSRADIQQLVKVGDIYLDSYPYSGMTSLIDPLQAGLPPVVFKGEVARSRMGAALLQEIGLSDLIAQTETVYIQLAISLGLDPKLRQQKSHQIQQKMQGKPRFLDSNSYSHQIEVAFQKIFEKYLSEPLDNNLNLRDINLIIFPDWSQSEDSLYEELAQVISEIATQPHSAHITLLIDSSNVFEEDANLILSSIALNLMQEDLDITEGAEISLIGQIKERQWKALLPRLSGRIILENENKEAIALVKAETLPSYEVSGLSDQLAASFFLT